jgi:hypothetical protein
MIKFRTFYEFSGYDKLFQEGRCSKELNENYRAEIKPREKSSRGYMIVNSHNP